MNVTAEEINLTVSFRIFSLAVSFLKKIMNIQRLFNMKPMLLQAVNLGDFEFLGFHISLQVWIGP